MKIDRTENYTVIYVSKDTFSEFNSTFMKSQKQFINQNIIVLFSENIDITVQHISLFLDLSNLYKNNGTSFVVICGGIDIDKFPENFNIVPTLTEAIDIVEIEDIERDLGF